MSDATKRSCAWSTSTDRGDVAGVVELWDDDLLTDFSKRVFNPDTYQGHDGIRRFYAGGQGDLAKLSRGQGDRATLSLGGRGGARRG
jgi:hypothetical protein